METQSTQLQIKAVKKEDYLVRNFIKATVIIETVKVEVETRGRVMQDQCAPSIRVMLPKISVSSIVLAQLSHAKTKKYQYKMKMET